MEQSCSYCGKGIVGQIRNKECFLCMRWLPTCQNCIDNFVPNCISCVLSEEYSKKVDVSCLQQ